MCKIRIVHFSTHDVCAPIATHPFSDTPSGDFISPNVIHRCDCTLDAASLLDLPENNTPSSLPLSPCPWHNCCLIWYQAVLCRWYWDNREVLNLEEEPDVETSCPNCFVIGEYHPLRMVLDLDPWQGGSRFPAWEGRDKVGELPSFPAGELFYSNEIVEADTVDQESAGLYEDRTRVSTLGMKLRMAKEQLKKAIFVASVSLDSLEMDLGMNEGLQRIVEDPALLLLRMREAQDLVREVRYAEVMAALAFGDLMKCMGFVLTALNKMPGEGQTVTSLDGSYSVSRDQLNMADLEPPAIAYACNGPLKQSPTLQGRLQVIQDTVEVFRRREASRRGVSKPVSRPARAGANTGKVNL
ncbi:hypothetical protein C8A03DRAFT_35424 [Achaetomium macrosporum]|uniref:Uncharacterized protein n=1 Tax=Achaetomium macrosporum TaxID=79813 RepID=A0AAN7C8F7_9PEZI|nr:hypothetical protein C8A03DRAFT_35424 [Achaetomium macrosporum]